MRHGESKANVAEIILSHLENGVKEDYTLTQKGEAQVRDSAEKVKSEGLLDENTLIYSSPFSRCKKTAEITKEVLGVKGEIVFDERLRERNFGDFEKTHNSNYQKVWDADASNPTHKNDNVESAKGVLARGIAFGESRTVVVVRDPLLSGSSSMGFPLIVKVWGSNDTYLGSNSRTYRASSQGESQHVWEVDYLNRGRCVR